ncbi:hypothetical protein BGW38_010569 [Lunasporangiospora selenospora]|uniref:Methyltransferase domain-containing protein n=1 Tax=Lunasporangiospora selenospora TaxID=979761 RepID=A0A9P6FW37_9FUNG|nr:hypothetical protein BGW38_010569 [Lunasporangiospora selenospora]
MGNSVSSTLSAKKAAIASHSSPSLTSTSTSTYGLGTSKKPSLFERSKSSLAFRKRSKSSLAPMTDDSLSLSTSSSNQKGSNGNRLAPAYTGANRHYSIDSSSDGHSDYSLNSGDSGHASTPHKQRLASTDSSASSGNNLHSAPLPDWAQRSRRCEDGRTRHTVESAPYMLPNDLTESDRLDAQHYLVRFVFKGNYNVKLDTDGPLRILDVATGTGVWALEMAHELPNAEIHGVDISPIFPAEIKPKNVHFQLCNILDGLPFPDNHFDFIYQRLLVYALSPDQRRQVNRELLRILKPGGHIQLVESDGIVYSPGVETERVNQLSLETSLRHGVDPREVQRMKPGLKHAGFVNVNSFHIALPVGEWGSKAGLLSRQNMHGLATIWLKGEIGRMTQEECDVVLAKTDREVEENHSYYKVWLVVGTKPLVNDSAPTSPAASSMPSSPTPTTMPSVSSARRDAKKKASTAPLSPPLPVFGSPVISAVHSTSALPPISTLHPKPPLAT